MNILVPGLLFFGVAHSPGQMPADTETPGLSREQTPAGTRLIHFSHVDDGVYKGSKPRSDADYRFLQSLHVKYIVDLQVIPLAYWLEKRKAKRYGIVLIPGRMNASPVSPSEKHIEAILAVLRDERYHPVYFHCALGRDRTSLIAALYKMYFLGMPPQNALRYLHESGYKDGWVRSGLKRYLERHPTPPPALQPTGRLRVRDAAACGQHRVGSRKHAGGIYANCVISNDGARLSQSSRLILK